jgi:hypothetical protein
MCFLTCRTVDTIGQTDRTFADNYRAPHTTQMHVIERWKLSADGNSVDVSVDVDDPGCLYNALARPEYNRPRSLRL